MVNKLAGNCLLATEDKKNNSEPHNFNDYHNTKRLSRNKKDFVTENNLSSSKKNKLS
jgi:hypothetical protein